MEVLFAFLQNRLTDTMVRPLISGLILAGIGCAQPFDLAPYVRSNCRTDRPPAAQTTFDYGHPAGLVAREDGGRVYGLQWSAPTRYEPVSYAVRASAEEVRGPVTLPSRNPYRDAWITVRLPKGTAVYSVSIDGKEWRGFDRAAGRIRLPRSGKPLDLAVKTNICRPKNR